MLAFTGSQELQRLEELGIKQHALVFDETELLPLARNRICQKAMELNADYLLFINTNMTYQRNFIYDLLKSDVDIISPLYFKASPPFAPVCAYRMENDKQLLIPLLNYEKGLIEVDITGCGGMLIKIDVLNKMKYPWFDYEVYKPTGELSVSEDVVFCGKAQELGFKIYVDTNIVAEQITTANVGEDCWLDLRERTVEYITANLLDVLAKVAQDK